MLNLSDLMPDEAFKLDGRTIEQRLQDFDAYARQIPFSDEGNSVASWSEAFFPKGEVDLRTLAARYSATELSDGKLPPQQVFLLAFLRMLDTPRSLLNSLPEQHRQLYYRELLGLVPRAAQPDRVGVTFDLEPDATELLLPAGTALDAGQDSQGQSLHCLLDRPLQANVGRLSDLRWVRLSDQGVQCHNVQSDDVPFPAAGVRLFSAQAQEQTAVKGRVIAAEILALSSGQRELTVTFGSNAEAGTLQAALSTGKGWLSLPPMALAESESEINVVFSASADLPAIVPPQGLDGFWDRVPLLKLSREDGKEVPTVIKIRAQTTRPTDLAFASQDGVTPPDQSCQPFGVEPGQGACVRL
ncbi:MAG: hypothetical protein K2Q15_13025, partial [Burkholderiales bacterium]|nr:hypothetical protein [Burkholderiales bacterium]